MQANGVADVLQAHSLLGKFGEDGAPLLARHRRGLIHLGVLGFKLGLCGTCARHGVVSGRLLFGR